MEMGGWDGLVEVEVMVVGRKRKFVTAKTRAAQGVGSVCAGLITSHSRSTTSAL